MSDTKEDLHREITQLEAELDRAARDAEGLREELRDKPCAELVTALRANIADPTNITWRRVLEALRKIEEAGD